MPEADAAPIEGSAAAWSVSFGAAVNGLRADHGLAALPLGEANAPTPAEPVALPALPADPSPAALVGAAFGELAHRAVPDDGGQTVWTWRDGAARFGLVVGPTMKAVGLGGGDGRGGVWGVCVAIFSASVGRGRRESQPKPRLVTTGWGDPATRRQHGGDPIRLLAGVLGGGQ